MFLFNILIFILLFVVVILLIILFFIRRMVWKTSQSFKNLFKSKSDTIYENPNSVNMHYYYKKKKINIENAEYIDFEEIKE